MQKRTFRNLFSPLQNMTEAAVLSLNKKIHWVESLCSERYGLCIILCLFPWRNQKTFLGYEIGESLILKRFGGHWQNWSTPVTWLQRSNDQMCLLSNKQCFWLWPYYSLVGSVGFSEGGGAPLGDWPTGWIWGIQPFVEALMRPVEIKRTSKYWFSLVTYWFHLALFCWLDSKPWTHLSRASLATKSPKSCPGT